MWQGFYQLIILLMSVDLIGEKNQVILEYMVIMKYMYNHTILPQYKLMK